MLDEPTPGSFATCPICYWTDAHLVAPAVREALFLARASYAAIGASSRDWTAVVRPPAAGEVRTLEQLVPISTSPRAEAAASAQHAIERAFADVPHGDRVSLRAAYRADNYGSEAPIDWADGDVTWHEIPGDVLDYFGRTSSVFVFGNLASFRYYLPAYMSRALETGETMCVVPALDSRTSGPTPGPPAEVEALDDAQRAAVALFLRYVIDFLGPDPTAARALDRIWLPAATGSAHKAPR